MSPAGLVALGALDSSLIFFLPLGIDVVLILLTARNPEWFWAYSLAATAGSVVGAGGTYWIGHKLGQDGIRRWIGKSQLDRVQSRVSHKAAPAIALLGLIPPPFPFTALLLASGAFGLNTFHLLGTLAAVRLVRFGTESALAAQYGQRILTWMESTTFELVVGALIVVALAGTMASAFSVIRGARQGRTARHSAPHLKERAGRDRARAAAPK